MKRFAKLSKFSVSSKLLKLSLPLLLIICSSSYAEFVKVVDADGYVNVRRDQSVSSPVIGRVASGEFVYVSPANRYDNWLLIRPAFDDYQQWELPKDADHGVVGYIHRSRVDSINEDRNGLGTEIFMSTFDESAGRIEFSDRNGNVIVKIQSEDFNYPANAHKFTEVHTSHSWGDSIYLSHYNGQPFWGTDGSIPNDTNHYKSMTVHLDGRTTHIPKHDIEALFNIDLRNTQVYYDALTDSVYISITE